ncbi:MAG: cytochrome c oxidase assembly protein [Thermomicrobiales bacterium]|nr:cytochrome c oxidase assembly protein [Thermomicrobiales bacterium]
MLHPITNAPLYHIGGPEPTGPFYTHWIVDPSIAVLIMVLTAAYFIVIGPLNRRRPGAENRPVSNTQIRWFLAGQLLLLISLGPPLDDWSHYFFSSAHMVQHLLLMFAVVPCWIKGTPPWLLSPMAETRVGHIVFTVLPRALPGFVLATMIIVLWHFPPFYNLTLENQLVHTLQHTFFIITGFLFFWPIMSTIPESPQLSPLMKCLYLFAQTIPSGLVGAMIVYAAPGLYPHYAQASQRPFGLSLAEDQVLGGVIMWVGMNAVFLVMISVIFLKYAAAEEAKDQEAIRTGTSGQRIVGVKDPAGVHTA